MPEPPPLYDHGPGTPLDIDRAFYTRLAEDLDGRTAVERFVIPIRSGRAWTVPGAHLCRIVAVEGPQVGDFNVWNRRNPRERFWASRTRQLHGTHVTTFDRLWSCLPYLRPMLTFTADAIRYGRDADGAGCHDLLGTRCDPYVRKMLNGEEFDLSCHSNLVRAVAPYRLTEFDVHDVLNVFMVTGLRRDGRYFAKACPAKKGDYLEFFAEMDLLCALSTCPGGDISVPLMGPHRGDPLPTCKPLAVEVYRPAPALVAGWAPRPPVEYRGGHGLRSPESAGR
jgi:uncharacterized protein YcgI (DUF1989 family)